MDLKTRPTIHCESVTFCCLAQKHNWSKGFQETSGHDKKITHKGTVQQLREPHLNSDHSHKEEMFMTVDGPSERRTGRPTNPMLKKPTMVLQVG